MQSRVLAILVAIVLALVATAALVIYVNGADRRAISDQQPVRVWVAEKPIKAGTRGEDARNRNLIVLREMARSNVANDAIRSVTQLQGRFAAVDIVPGEQLLQRRWVGAEEVAGFVTPGDSVSLTLSMKRPQPGTGKEVEQSQFLLQNVQVLAVGATAISNSSSQGGGGRVAQGRGSQNLTAVTLSIKDQDVPRVVYAAENGSIYLSLLPPDAREVRSNPYTADNVTPR